MDALVKYQVVGRVTAYLANDVELKMLVLKIRVALKKGLHNFVLAAVRNLGQ